MLARRPEGTTLARELDLPLVHPATTRPPSPPRPGSARCPPNPHGRAPLGRVRPGAARARRRRARPHRTRPPRGPARARRQRRRLRRRPRRTGRRRPLVEPLPAPGSTPDTPDDCRCRPPCPRSGSTPTAAAPCSADSARARRDRTRLRGRRRRPGPPAARPPGAPHGPRRRRRTGTPVRHLTRTATGWRVETPAGVVDADAVVLAVPAPAAARLLAAEVPAAAAELADVETASMVITARSRRPAARPRRAHPGPASSSRPSWGWSGLRVIGP